MTGHVAGLTGRIQATVPRVDGSRLLERAFVRRCWAAETLNARRRLLRLAWSRISARKAAGQGGIFDPDRLV